MCGINVIYKFAQCAVSKPDLVRMCSSLEHRGPDEAGLAVLENGQVGLGHVRLSIMDVQHGQQPMFSADGALAITYNGEIYDLEKHRKTLRGLGYSFNTTTDTEVVLALYQAFGTDFVDYLNGEFAFVIWDGKAKKLVAGRDRCGIKPLFYRLSAKEFLISSEAKAILSLDRVERALDPEFFYSTPFSFQIQGISPFKGIESCKPGHLIIIDENGIEERCYWTPNYETDTDISFDEAKHALRQHFQQAVERRMLADVPLGAYLSGGIDSTLTCAAMAKCTENLKAFHLSYKNTAYDESDLAQKIATDLKIELHTLDCSLDDLADNLEQAIFHSELLIANPGHVGKMLLSKFARDKGVKVCLTGEGADEFFAGYAFFKQEAMWQQLSETPDDESIRRLYTKFEEKESRSQELNWTKSNSWKKDHYIFGYPSFKQTVVEQLNKMVAPNIFSDEFKAQATMVSPINLLKATYNSEKFKKMDPLNASRLVSLSTLSEYIIPVLGDRSEMANSLECRTPFLDVNIMDFAAGLPPEFLLNMDTLQEKHILHEAFKADIPEFMYTQPKHPFSADNWYTLYSQTEQGKALFEKHLRPEALKKSNIFNLSYVASLWNLWIKLPAHSPMLKKIQSTMGTILCTQIMYDRFVVNNCHPKKLIQVTDYSPQYEMIPIEMAEA